ncbi:SRPBCC family protein [Streptomyces sp. NPDC093094]|uniref:SRPBCC family protein n=1 Tax=Streptomyces sp. NPDC093094 TaxID=3366026 RepID=UPI00382CE895
MTDTARSTASKATDAAQSNPLTDLAHSEAADRLKAELQEYLAAQAQRVLAGAGRKLGETTVKLNDIAEGNSPGFAKLALEGGRKLAEGKSPLRAALETGAGQMKDKAMGALKNLGGGKGKGKGKGGGGQKPTVIMEYIDVGVDLRTAYDQWTQYQDFSTFAKGVKSANRANDVDSDWNLKVFWSSRSWKGHTTEQVPDDRIAWSSEGAKGTTKGVVSFHRLADNLTRVLLVLEYYPSGLFEKTGNIWRAQGRRARLDLKHFARYITLKGEAKDGWRGEIRDGEVVKSHEDALAEEEQEESEDRDESTDEERDEQPRGEDEYEDEDEDEDEDDEEYPDEDAEYDDAGRADDAEYDDDGEDAEDSDEPEGRYEDEDEYEDGGEERGDDEYEPEPEPEPEPRSRRSRR